MNRQNTHLTGRAAAWVLATGGGLAIVGGAMLIAESVGVFTVPGLNVSIADGGLGILVGAAAVALALQAHAVFDTAEMIDAEMSRRKRGLRDLVQADRARGSRDPVLTRRSYGDRVDPDLTPHAAE